MIAKLTQWCRNSGDVRKISVHSNLVLSILRTRSDVNAETFEGEWKLGEVKFGVAQKVDRRTTEHMTNPIQYILRYYSV